jgi:hypothetical protein
MAIGAFENPVAGHVSRLRHQVKLAAMPALDQLQTGLIRGDVGSSAKFLRPGRIVAHKGSFRGILPFIAVLPIDFCRPIGPFQR